MSENEKWKLDIAILDSYAKALVSVLKVILAESEDAIHALILAVFKGEDAREEALGGGGSPVPERLAFEIGIIAGPVAKQVLLIIIKDFLLGLLKK